MPTAQVSERLQMHWRVTRHESEPLSPRFVATNSKLSRNSICQSSNGPTDSSGQKSVVFLCIATRFAEKRACDRRGGNARQYKTSSKHTAQETSEVACNVKPSPFSKRFSTRWVRCDRRSRRDSGCDTLTACHCTLTSFGNSRGRKSHAPHSVGTARGVVLPQLETVVSHGSPLLWEDVSLSVEERAIPTQCCGRSLPSSSLGSQSSSKNADWVRGPNLIHLAFLLRAKDADRTWKLMTLEVWLDDSVLSMSLGLTSRGFEGWSLSSFVAEKRTGWVELVLASHVDAIEDGGFRTMQTTAQRRPTMCMEQILCVHRRRPSRR